jgi:hypothetical protein
MCSNCGDDASDKQPVTKKQHHVTFLIQKVAAGFPYLVIATNGSLEMIYKFFIFKMIASGWAIA